MMKHSDLDWLEICGDFGFLLSVAWPTMPPDERTTVIAAFRIALDTLATPEAVPPPPPESGSRRTAQVQISLRRGGRRGGRWSR